MPALTFPFGPLKVSRIVESAAGLFTVGWKKFYFSIHNLKLSDPTHIWACEGFLSMLDHDYALLGGLNRAKVGRYLGIVAATVSAAIVFVLLSVASFVQKLGLPANLTPSVMSLAGAGAVFGALYWLFNRYLWRWPLLSMALKVPNLGGEWRCKGATLAPDGSVQHEWAGAISIYQRWDKIRVRLKTEQSGSDSIAAALVCDDDDGYRLLYNYRNQPKIGEVDLKGHLGFCDLHFAKDLKSAEGEYFNGHGRNTFGTMRLTRK